MEQALAHFLGPTTRPHVILTAPPPSTNALRARSTPVTVDNDDTDVLSALHVTEVTAAGPQPTCYMHGHTSVPHL